MSLIAGSINIELEALDKGFQKGLDNAGKSVKDLENKSENLAKKGLDNLNSGLGNVANTIKTGLLVGLGGLVAGVGILGKKALDASAEMESFGLQLETAFQGNKEMAKDAQDQITKFAAKTPYDLGQVMNSFIKLKNLGLDPSERALTSYGNTASAMGKDLNQMIEAVADASTGEFERLKEFGIKASKQGDQVAFTFAGVTKTVKNDSKSIQEYLLNIGETNFAGSMDKQATTFSGLMSTMSDTVNQKLAQLANNTGFLEFSKNIVTGITNIVDKVDIDALIEDLSLLPSLINTLFNGGTIWEDAIPTMFYDLAYNITGSKEAMNQVLPFFGKVRDSIQFVKTETSRLINDFKEIWGQISSFLKPSIDELFKAFNDLIPALTNLWNVLSPVIIPTLEVLGKIIGVVIVASIKILIDQITSLINTGVFLANETSKIITRLTEMWGKYGESITNIFNGYIEFFKGWIDIIVGVFTGDKTKIENGFKTMLGGVEQIFKGVFDAVKKVVEDTINSIVKFVTEKFEWLKGKAIEMSSLVQNIQNTGANAVQNTTGLDEKRSKTAAKGILGAFTFGLGAFANGGVVGGNSYSGDNVPIRANSGEMVLNEAQQANLFAIANGSKQTAGVSNYNVTINGNYLGSERDKRNLAKDLKDAFNQVILNNA